MLEPTSERPGVGRLCAGLVRRAAAQAELLGTAPRLADPDFLRERSGGYRARLARRGRAGTPGGLGGVLAALRAALAGGGALPAIAYAGGRATLSPVTSRLWAQAFSSTRGGGA